MSSSRLARPLRAGAESLRLAGRALGLWNARQALVAAAAAIGVALLIGVATVLIPNPIFGREIPPVWWNYPVWLVTSALSGMLLATYVRPGGATPAVGAAGDPEPATSPAAEAGADPAPRTGPDADGGGQEGRGSRLGVAGGVLAWFAVGCPVCNKLALLALGYAGAITWFAPLQPVLAAAALVLTGVALVWRLRGQIACPVRPSTVAVR